MEKLEELKIGSKEERKSVKSLNQERKETISLKSERRTAMSVPQARTKQKANTFHDKCVKCL